MAFAKAGSISSCVVVGFVGSIGVVARGVAGVTGARSKGALGVGVVPKLGLAVLAPVETEGRTGAALGATVG